MRDVEVKYIIVTTKAFKNDVKNQMLQVTEAIENGYEILSAAGDGMYVHYVLIRYVK